ncbi:FxsA family membrane protein [Streptomyces sp. NPDC057539]|uniref:FxsA family membrane protein n=1 Tax=unclassified Streptomyces TaxID=2593676 RepID=UPI00201F3E3F|nr:FxsA family membrane protein [Streptomyces sp. 35G-GA-8]MCL7378997.1 FxsA family protein [Streptomyces sp. 35G-GA-8]
MTTAQSPRTVPKRSRARTFVPLGIAAWLVLEIWLLTVVADVAGGLTVLLLLVGAVVLGAVVIKSAGRRAFRNLTETLQRQQQRQPGDAPETEAATGSTGNGFLMLGGLLIMLPGLITDVLGLLLLIPPVRMALGRYAERSLERRMRETAVPGSLGDAFQQARMRRPDGKVVQGEVIKHDDEPRSPGHPGDAGPRPPLTP